MRGAPLVRGLLLLAALASACAAPPPAADGPFEDARALAAAPDGTLWVVDADRVVALRDGAVVRTLGGVGTGDGAFLDPVAIDPTNGLAVFVADRGAGVVLQFTAEGRLAQTIVVPDVDPARPVRRPAGDRGREAARARPVAVAAGAAGTLYVLDAGRAHILQMTADGTVERVLASGNLSDPVGLAVGSDGDLWVADRGLNALKRIDPFGATRTVREMPPGVDGVVSVAVDGAVVTVGASAVVQVRLDLEPGRIAVGPPVPGLRSVLPVGGRLLGLTASALVDLGESAWD